MDISSVQQATYGGSKYWMLVVDEFSDMCWSAFLNAKSELPQRMSELVKRLKTYQQIDVKNIICRIQVKNVRCDNAGENKKFQKLCEKIGLPINFEYTGPGSPQFNGPVERKFATLYGKVRAMLNAANLPLAIRNGIWAEAASTASDLENALVSATKETPAYQLLHRKEHPTIRGLHPFGEMAVIEINANRKIRSKLENRGKMCIYLGRALNHSLEIGRFLNLSTNRVLLSRDITWLGKTYGEWKGLQGSVIPLEQVDNEDTNTDIVNRLEERVKMPIRIAPQTMP
jgi:hypothetical protein